MKLKNQLRLNNLVHKRVLHKNRKGKTSEFSVTDRVSLEVLQDIQENGQKNYKPIELTEAYVEKAGFELYDYEDDEDEGLFRSYRMFLPGRKYYMTVELNPNNLHSLGFDFRWHDSEVAVSQIKYVHELQNFYYAVTGQELEFKALT